MLLGFAFFLGFGVWVCFKVGEDAPAGVLIMALAVLVGPVALALIWAVWRLARYRIEVHLEQCGWLLEERGFLKKEVELRFYDTFRLRAFANGSAQLDLQGRDERTVIGRTLGQGRLAELANLLGGVEDAGRRIGEEIPLSVRWRSNK